MKVKIKIEVDIDMNDFPHLEYVLKDINHYVCKGVQMRATHYRTADYNYYVHVPIRKGAKINYTENSIIYTHESKLNKQWDT